MRSIPTCIPGGRSEVARARPGVRVRVPFAGERSSAAAGERLRAPGGAGGLPQQLPGLEVRLHAAVAHAQGMRAHDGPGHVRGTVPPAGAWRCISMRHMACMSTGQATIG